MLHGTHSKRKGDQLWYRKHLFCR
ncbi:phage DNA packaging protein J [uncultured Vibrio sp.]